MKGFNFTTLELISRAPCDKWLHW